MLTRSMLRHALLLGTGAALIAAGVAATRLATAPRIEQNRVAAEQRVLRELLPADLHDATLIAFPVDDTALLGLRGTRQAYRIAADTETDAVILPVVARDGYSGDIDLLVAIDAAGRVTGVDVLAHRETPGLGDKIERRRGDWLEQFVGRSRDDPATPGWQVIKDGGVFDSLTGATITARAVTHAVKNALDYLNGRRDAFKAHRATLTGTATAEDSPNG